MLADTDNAQLTSSQCSISTVHLQGHTAGGLSTNFRIKGTAAVNRQANCQPLVDEKL